MVLENEYIEVFVLPDVGGKVWGAVVKETGHEFIYRNEVMKFRNISLRGPWTSGGIEFNFGVIGHTPATATPVDYTTRENEDGSVSVIVGAMDLPSRRGAFAGGQGLFRDQSALVQPDASGSALLQLDDCGGLRAGRPGDVDSG